MCGECAGTGVLGWTDTVKKWKDGTSTSVRVPDFCACKVGLSLWLERNGQDIRYIYDSEGNFKEGPVGVQ